MSDGLSVLFVCTGNIYRSPMAEAFFRAAAEERGLGFTTFSAGTLKGDRPIAPFALSQALRADPRMATHRSHHVRTEDIQAASLVLGMTRAHVRALVVLVPAAWNRTFTLKELVRRGASIGRRRPDQTLANWLVAVGADRSHADLLGDSVLDDISDPIGESASVRRSVAREIREAVEAIVQLISPG